MWNCGLTAALPQILECGAQRQDCCVDARTLSNTIQDKVMCHACETPRVASHAGCSQIRTADAYTSQLDQPHPRAANTRTCQSACCVLNDRLLHVSPFRGSCFFAHYPDSLLHQLRPAVCHVHPSGHDRHGSQLRNQQPHRISDLCSMLHHWSTTFELITSGLVCLTAGGGVVESFP